MTNSTAFKCTTCQVLFPLAEDLKIHHKSDWHRYNLKRKIAEMSPVSCEIFQRKLELLASADQTVKGEAHLKRSHHNPSSTEADHNHEPPDSVTKYPLPIKYSSICHSLFDHHVSQTMDENIAYMSHVFSFFIPDIEYLKDKKGLIQYLGNKLFEGHQCLFCNRSFKSLVAVRGHMISKGHASIGINTEEQEEELEPFYDYSESYRDLNFSNLKRDTIKALTSEIPPNEDDGWEDENEDEELANLIARHGLEAARINDYGNLVLPGRRGEAVHRSVSYVYRQRLPARHKDPSVQLALLHAKQLRTLTENGESALGKLRLGRMRQRSAEHQTEARIKHHQQFSLSIGMKTNQLNRTIRRAEKYFI